MLELFRFRWNVLILAELFERQGAKFVTLVMKLGVSRSVLNSTLRYLIGLGLVIPNPGYGHPMRPEYVLTESGGVAAVFCRELLCSVRDRNEGYLLQSKWALPLLFILSGREARFTELRMRLAPISPRALSVELKRLTETGLVDRCVLGEFPPVAIYALNPRGRPYSGIFDRYRKEVESLPFAGE